MGETTDSAMQTRRAEMVTCAPMIDGRMAEVAAAAGNANGHGGKSPSSEATRQWGVGYTQNALAKQLYERAKRDATTVLPPDVEPAWFSAVLGHLDAALAAFRASDDAHRGATGESQA